MKRLYYLTDTIDSTESVSNDLHAAGIDDWHFHVLSRDEAGLYTHHVHSANWFQQYDLLRCALRGALFGFIAGMLIAVMIGATPVLGAPVSTLGAVFTVLIITMFGTWVGGLVGLQTENHKVRRFHDALEAGKYLIMVDIAPEQEHTVTKLMKIHHPEATPVRAERARAERVPDRTSPAPR